MIGYQSCKCGEHCENGEHYFLRCNNFRIYCNQLFENLNSINVDVNINNLLFGDRNVSFEVIVLYFLIFNFI